MALSQNKQRTVSENMQNKHLCLSRQRSPIAVMSKILHYCHHCFGYWYNSVSNRALYSGTHFNAKPKASDLHSPEAGLEKFCLRGRKLTFQSVRIVKTERERKVWLQIYLTLCTCGQVTPTVLGIQSISTCHSKGMGHVCVTMPVCQCL